MTESEFKSKAIEKPYVVIAFYKFVSLLDCQKIQKKLLNKLNSLNICGTILLAAEGINGTIAGFKSDIDEIIVYFSEDPKFSDIIYKFSYSDLKPFKHTKVKIKKEIVKLSQEGIDPTCFVGTYVEPEDWNALISDPGVVVIDTRNQYEVKIGSFKYAVDPKIDTFTQLPDFIEKNMSDLKDKRIAMFCTGGIRCEKSTAYMIKQGVEKVYHLSGGILNYLEKIKIEDSLWEGECFVFDGRVTVDHNLERGNYHECEHCDQIIKNDGTIVNNKLKQNIDHFETCIFSES